MKYGIRLAVESDKQQLLLLMKAHAEFEGHKLENAHYQFPSDIEALPATIFVVYVDDNLVGYMSIIKQFSTWDMDWYLYLDCLYFTLAARGQGLGLKLMERLKTLAKESGIKTIQWQTPKDNVLAIEFYQKLGAINKEKQRFFWAV